MRLPFTRKQQYIPDKKLELFIEDTPRRRHYLILVPAALLLIVAGMSWYKNQLDQDNEMQEALTSGPQSVHRLMAQADAAEIEASGAVRQSLPTPVALESKGATGPQGNRAAQQAENEKAIESAVLDWKRAWEASDVDAYLGHYAASFTPDDGSSLEQWKALRSKRLNSARNIEISLSNVDIRFESADTARVSFDQRYSSKTFTDNTHKVLLVREHEGAWKIEREMAD